MRISMRMSLLVRSFTLEVQTLLIILWIASYANICYCNWVYSRYLPKKMEMQHEIAENRLLVQNKDQKQTKLAQKSVKQTQVC